MARLGDICEIQSGGTPARSNCTYWEGGTIPWVKISDIKGKHLNKTEEYITESGLQNSSAKLFPKGTILYTIFATLGETCILDIDAATNQAIAGLTVKSDNICREYLYYYLFSLKSVVDNLGRGVAQNNINMSILRNLPVPLPPLDEQRHIAAVLDKVSDLIAKRRQQLDKLDELVKSRFIEMFGDPMTNPYNLPKVILGSVLTIEPQNGLYKPQSDYVSDGTGVPILRIDSFYEGKVSNLSSLKRLICSEIELKRYSLYENDIVINRVNSIEYLGKCGLIQGLVENTVFESNMMRLHVDEHKFHPVYITKLLCSEFIYQQILRRAKKAVNQASINQKDVQSFVVYMPPIEQQDQFAAFVKQTDKSKLAIQKSLEKLEILKKALMQKYFG